MIKEIKYGGVTTTPSDYDCQDGDLAVTSNIIPDDRKLVNPKEPDNPLTTGSPSTPVTFDHKPVFKHVTTDGDTHWITYWNNLLYAYPTEATNQGVTTVGEVQISGLALQGEPKKIDAIGNTIVVLDADGSVHYVVYKEPAYTYLGDHIPTLELQFGLRGEVKKGETTGVNIGGLTPVEGSYLHYQIPDDKIATITNYIDGTIHELRDDSSNKDKFCFPFFVRYALKLYDGTYTNVSAPVFMDLCNGNVPYVCYRGPRGEYDLHSYGDEIKDIYAYLPFCDLLAMVLNYGSAFNGWEDIVKGVDVFVSSQFDLFDPNKPIEKDTYYIGGGFTPNSTYCCDDTNLNEYKYRQLYDGIGYSIDDYFRFVFPWVDREDDIANNSTFYKLRSFKFEEYNFNYIVSGIGYSDFTTIQIEENLLSVIETQKTLPDDYFSNDTVNANALFVYNSRINLANMSRQLFDGFRPNALMPPYDGSNATTYVLWYYVIIEENGIRTKVQSEYSLVSGFSAIGGGTIDIVPPYFYYPNPNAKKLIIKQQTGPTGPVVYHTFDLIPHPTLNGAYALFRGPYVVDAGGSYPEELDLLTVPIPYPSQIYTSEPYNPYVFKAENINQLPTAANIINIASTTQPMSQGQFGQFPLYVFSDIGVFALELGGNGAFSSLSPVTRDIILGDGESLTQLDDSLLFATKQGIMELVGKNTKCISTSLDKKSALPTLANISQVTGSAPQDTDFRSFIDGCRMVYDYVNARVIVFKEGASNAYIYSAKDQAWTLIPLVGLIDTINSYPDAYAVMEKTENNTTTYSIVDLATITDEDTADPPTPHEGWLITRPFDLGDSNEFKVIDRVRQNGVFEEYLISTNEQETYSGYSKYKTDAQHEGGYIPAQPATGAYTKIKQILYGSNDLINWFIVGSSDSRLLNGRTSSPFKWFRLAVGCTFKHGESLSSFTVSYRIKTENPHLF